MKLCWQSDYFKQENKIITLAYRSGGVLLLKKKVFFVSFMAFKASAFVIQDFLCKHKLVIIFLSYF